MIDFIYDFLAGIGFTHPLHPAVTHLPMGMIIGGFLFAQAAFFLKKPNFYKTAHQCSALALIGVPPTVLLGIMDWQRNFGGQWFFQIKAKLALTAIVTILLVIVYISGKNAEESPAKFIAAYAFALITAIGLGFLGGELLFMDA